MVTRVPTRVAPDIACPRCHRKEMRWVGTRTAIICSTCNHAYRVEDDGLVRIRGFSAALMGALRTIRDMSSMH